MTDEAAAPARPVRTHEIGDIGDVPANEDRPLPRPSPARRHPFTSDVERLREITTRARRPARSDRGGDGVLSAKRSERKSGSTWLRSYILALDQWLCHWQHVYEFTDDPQCLFRIQCLRSDETVKLADGTCVRAGRRVISLHLWNEHIPLMGTGGPSLAWARRVDRAVEGSLCALAVYLAEHPSFGDIVAIYGDMRLSGEKRSDQFLRIAARYGFETIGRQVDRRSVLHRIGDTILIVILMTATNVRALRSGPLRLTNARVWLSRAMLEKYRRAR